MRGCHFIVLLWLIKEGYMNKPITLVIEETKTKLAEIINTSGLPPFVIEPMLNTFLQEAHIASKRQYEIDKLDTKSIPS